MEKTSEDENQEIMEDTPLEERKPAAAQKLDNEDEEVLADPQESGEKTAKKRTWRKPKDKPKRPLSAYNIFFQHARSRIVQGMTEEATPEEVVRSIEAILSKSREKRRHRKSHGRISFGDLARAIADQWKSINPKHKEIFDHYAEVDMIRYRREVKVWKEKKELETEANAMAKHNSFISQMSSSFSSAASSSAEDYLDGVPDESDESGARGMRESFNSSYSSGNSPNTGKRRMPTDSMSLMIQRQQHILRQQLREENNEYRAVTSGNGSGSGQMQSSIPGSQAFHQSFNTMPSSLSFETSLDMPPSQAMQQLKMQQEQQLQQMRQLQLQQRQIQQQIQLQRLKQQQLQLQQQQQNLARMGHSSFSDIRNPSSFMSTQQMMPNQTASSFVAPLDSSINLSDALQAPSVHVSDYSSSTLGHGSGFGGSGRSFGGLGSYSDVMNAGSFNHDMQVQMNLMQQAQNDAFRASAAMGGTRQQQERAGIFEYSENNEDQQQHDLRGMMDMGS